MRADRSITVLGLETSCDETAAAVVRRSAAGEPMLLANIVRSQQDHEAYGGVVPEIAARAHVEVLDGLVAQALREADITLGDVDAVAATAGPGLIGGLIVGLTMGKALAVGAGKPFLAINHLEGHARTAGLTDQVTPPYLLLLVSGGHTQTVAVLADGRYRRIGTTIDDALGEAFDKAAKLLGLGYPGGPAVERAARTGDPTRFALPRPMKGRLEPDFSFSGLKTALRLTAEKAAPLSDQDIADLCAAFQATVVDAVIDRVGRALDILDEDGGEPPAALVAAGGVAANRAMGAALAELANARGIDLVVPPISLCGDNAAMIAWAGVVRRARGESHDLAFAPCARWPLDEASAAPGAKA